METKSQSHCWWFESYNCPKSSPWLQSTLSELNEKTKAMLKLIEEDADSFAQRAEMYYKKRPELINMVEDFYRAHRSLAERYDQLKSDRVVRLRSPITRSISSPQSEFEYDYAFDSEAAESEVDDPDEEEGQIDQEIEKSFTSDDQLIKLRRENEVLNNIINRKDEEKNKLVVLMKETINQVALPLGHLKQACEVREEEPSVKGLENNDIKLKNEIAEKDETIRHLRDALIHKETEKSEVIRQLNCALQQKDEEKREAIRQLSIAMEILREEIRCLKKTSINISPSKKSSNFFQIFNFF